MYEKNCLHQWFIAEVPYAKYVLVLQMHPSSQQEKEDFVSKIRAIDMHTQVHTIHAHTLHTTNDPETLTLLTLVKGTSSVITCHTYETFVSLLQLCHQKTKKKSGQSHTPTTLPFTIVGAKNNETLLDVSAITVLTEKSLQWETVLEISQPASSMLGVLHMHVHACTCEPS